MAAGVAGCGGANKSATTPEVVEEEAIDEGPADGVDVSSVCADLCQRVTDQCADDPASEFDADACEDSCLDETDGVLGDVGRCLDAADSCGTAVGCRDKFGD